MLLFEPKVYLEPIKHRYFDNAGREYTSVSALKKLLKKPFDPKIVEYSAVKEGIPVEEMQARWDKKRDDSAEHGTRVHNALETYGKTAQISDEDKDLKSTILSIYVDYKDYGKSFDELILYNEEYGIAGTTDKAFLVTKHKSSKFDIEDYKNYSKGVQYFSEHGNRLLSPFDYMEDCTFIECCFQLSIYAFMLEELTGRKCRQLFIREIPIENPLMHKRIPVPYLKHQVIELLTIFKNKKPGTEVIEIPIIEEEFSYDKNRGAAF